MIYKQSILTINGNNAKLDEDIYLFRLDKNIELYFTIVNNKYKFNKSDLNNIINLTNASYFQMRLYKNAEVKYTFAIQPTDNEKAILTITDDLIDEPIEVGDYDFQISLLDADKSSMISLPIVSKQIHVCEPLVTDASETGTAVLGLSTLESGEIVDAFDEEGNYIRKVHVNGELISAELFNKWEEALETNSSNIKTLDSQFKDSQEEIKNKKITNIIYQLIESKHELRDINKFMANPPEITVNQSSDSVISANTYYNPNTADVFTYPIGKMEKVGDSYPNNRMVRNTAVTTTKNNGNIIVEFSCNTDKFELWCIGKAGKYRVRVDDDNAGYKYIYNSSEFIDLPPADGKVYHILHNFGEKKQRNIKIEIVNGFFGGVVLPTGDSITKALRKTKTSSVIVGDSYSENYTIGFARLCGELLDWDNNVSGVGGTGYVNPSSDSGRVKIFDRLDNDVISLNPNYVIFCAGINDSSYTDVATFKTNADSCFKKVLTELPNAKVIIVSPWWPHTPTENILKFNEGLKDVALSNNLPYIDSLTGSIYLANGTSIMENTGSWLYGNGNENKFNPFGNDSYYISSDNTHPNQAGYRYLAERLALAIRTLIKKM